MALYTAFFSYLILGVASNPTLIPRDAVSACSNLTTLLGANKVVTNKLDPQYINSRQDYWNARQSAYAPACIVFVKTTHDVSVAIKSIKAADAQFAIKANGHQTNNFFSSTDGGVLVDLSNMKGKSYNARTTLATYEPGNVWDDLYKFYEPYNRTVVGGRLGGVGTGLALGGGLSYLSPQYGMACDSFRELEVVLPSGEIVKASSTTNRDLFLGLKGGGGNAYGVVTKYTVQSRPIGQFYAGNLVWLFDKKDLVLQAIHDFIAYNTDPKASILPTYEKLLTPDINLNLDELITMFVVYDGPNPGKAFDNFTAIPHIVDSRSIKTYRQAIDMPLPYTADLTRADNTFRGGVHRIVAGDNSHVAALEAFRAWADANKGAYVHTGFYLYPVQRSLTDASAAQAGGNAMRMPAGPWWWAAYDIATTPGLSDAAYAKVQASFADMVKATPDAAGLPLFLNEAAYDQHPLRTFGAFAELKAAKAKYDPDGFFAKRTAGWSFD